MKSIRKLKKYGTAVAGSALLLGATLTGASASNHDLGDYPQPFVDEDGEVQASIVVGEDAATADVVGAIDIAGSLGQQAFTTEAIDSGVSVDGEETETALRQKVGNGDLMLDKSDYSVLMRENLEDSNGDNHFVTEAVGLDEESGSAVRTKVNGSQVLTVVPEASVDYEVSYAPGFETGEEVMVLGESYELVSVSGPEADLGTTMESSPSIGDSFEHGAYTVNVEGGNSNDGEILINVMEDGEQVDSGQLSGGETLDINDEFSVTADTVFYSSDEERWVIQMESVLSELQLEEGEAFPLDEDYRVQTVNSKDSDTLQGLELTNTLKTVDEPEEDDETAHLEEGETFSGPLDYFQVGFEGLTQKALDSIEVRDEYEVTYQDTEGFEHTLDIGKVEASTSASLDATNPFLNNSDDESEFRFFSSDSTWDSGSDAAVLDNDNDGVYTSQEDNKITAQSSGVSVSDSLTDFSTSDDVYASTTSGYSSSTDGIFVDNSDNGYFDAEGIIASGTSASLNLSSTFDGKMDVAFDGGTASSIILDNSGLLDSAQTITTVGLQSDAGSDIGPGVPVEVGSTGSYFIVDSQANNGDATSTLDVIGTNTVSESNLKGSTIYGQSVDSSTDFGVQTPSSSPGSIDSTGSGTINLNNSADLDTSPDVNAGDVLVVDADYTSSGDSSFTDGDEQFFVATADQGTGETSVSVVGQSGVSVTSGADIFKVTGSSDAGSSGQASVDSHYLDSGADIAAAINTEISGDGTASFNQAPYSSDQYVIESDSTASGSDVSVSASGSGTDLYTQLDFDDAEVDTGPDSVVSDGGNLADGNSYTELSSGDQIKYFDADGQGEGFDRTSDDVIDDKGGSGTYSTGSDTVETGVTPSNGDNLKTGLDLVKFSASDDTYNGGTDLVAVDENDDGVYDSGDTLIAGSAPGGILDETESEKTLYTDVSGHPVKIEWDPSAGSNGEVTLSYETFDTTLAPGDSYSQDTGYGFTLDADFNDLNGDSNADLSVSNADTSLEAQFGAELYESGGNVLVDEHGSSQVVLGYDGSDEISSVSFGGTPSAINEEDEETYTSFGSYVEVGSDMADVSVEVPEEQRKALHTVGGEASSGEGTVSTPAGWPQAGSLDSNAPEGHKILVGGPAINELTAELADQGLSRAQENYSEGTGYLELVDQAFEGNSALVVAGHSGEDTRSAAEYLANYGDHSETLSGTDTVQISTETGNVVE